MSRACTHPRVRRVSSVLGSARPGHPAGEIARNLAVPAADAHCPEVDAGHPPARASLPPGLLRACSEHVVDEDEVDALLVILEEAEALRVPVAEVMPLARLAEVEPERLRA